MAKKRKKYFAVKIGRAPGVYYDVWDNIKDLVNKYPGARVKGFSTEIAALNYINSEKINDIFCLPNKSDFNDIDDLLDTLLTIRCSLNNDLFKLEKQSLKKKNQNIKSKSSKCDFSIIPCFENNQRLPILIPAYAYIDGSYNDKTNTYGYGGFLIDSNGKEHILSGCAQNSSLQNVAGELAGATAAAKLAHKLKLTDIYIYYDFNGIEKFLQNGFKTKYPEVKTYISTMKSYMNSGLNIRFVKVKGHSDNIGNKRADKIAKQAVGLL